MDSAWYCRGCYSADYLEIISGPELDVYSLICNIQDPVDGHNQIAACLLCREFLKEVHSFRTEHHGIDKIIDDKLDIKPHNEQLIIRNKADDDLLQIEIKTEISQQIFESSPGNCNNNDTATKLLSKPHQNVNSDETAPASHGPYTCKICNRRYRLRQSLNAHKAVHLNDKDKLHKCSECSYTTVYKASLKSHIASKHNDEKPFSCDICGYRCKLKNALSFHIRSHMNDGENSHKCSECSFTTIYKRSLKDHYESLHCEELNFSCNMCSYRCKTKRQLSNHLKEHSNRDERLNKCSECNFTTIHKGSLKAHIANKHSDEKPFSCDMCSFRCKRKAGLLLHTRRHLNVKENPYKCSECSFTAITTSHLKRHIAFKHSDEKPFSCDKCGYRFKWKDGLSNHMRCHLKNKRPIKCSKCPFATKTEVNLNRHILSKHSDEKLHHFNDRVMF